MSSPQSFAAIQPPDAVSRKPLIIVCEACGSTGTLACAPFAGEARCSSLSCCQAVALLACPSHAGAESTRKTCSILAPARPRDARRVARSRRLRIAEPRKGPHGPLLHLTG